MLYGDDAVLVSHTQDGLQYLMNRFSHARSKFGLTVSIKETEIMAQDAPIPPSVSVNDSTLTVAENHRYLGALISSNAPRDAEINARI